MLFKFIEEDCWEKKNWLEWLVISNLEQLQPKVAFSRPFYSHRYIFSKHLIRPPFPYDESLHYESPIEA